MSSLKNQQKKLLTHKITAKITAAAHQLFYYPLFA